MENNDENDLDMLFLLHLLMEYNKFKKLSRPRQWGVRPQNRKRKQLGHFHNLIQIMIRSDQKQFYKYCRMSVPHFKLLLSLVESHLEKKSENALSPAHRLLITLNYLAHGCSMQAVAWNFLVGKSTVSGIIKETCTILWKVLQPLYLKSPNSNDEWLNLAADFSQKWNFQNCLGAIDGKHITIQAPKKSGTEYFNYKKFFSIVLLAVCDANYKFTMVDIGAFGSLSDGCVFADCSMGETLARGKCNIPKDGQIAGVPHKVPYFFAADAAFPLKKYIMRPYPGLGLNTKERVFNYRLSRARRTIENAFGILVSRWRILRTPIIAEVPTIEAIVGALVCLHNFIMVEENKSYAFSVYTPKDADTNEKYIDALKDSEFQEIKSLGSNSSSDKVREIRDSLAAYYCSSVGEIKEQYKYVNRGTKNFT